MRKNCENVRDENGIITGVQRVSFRTVGGRGMARNDDWAPAADVKDIMEKMLEAFPDVFQGFDVNGVLAILTKGKKARKPIKLTPVRYPFSVGLDYVYIVEVFEEQWEKMGQKQKNLAVFHIMCRVPESGFDPQSNNYAKQRRYDYELYQEEFAVADGVPDWYSPDARDPFDAAGSDDDQSDEAEEETVARCPVTKESIENVGADDEDAEEEVEEGAALVES